MARQLDISGKSELTARFGWSVRPTSAELLSAVFDPYVTAAETSADEE
jgi:hypothetical protein